MNNPSAPGRPELAGGAKNKPVNLSGSSAHPESCTLKWPIPQLRHEGFPESKHMGSVGIAIISEGWLYLKRPQLTRGPSSVVYPRTHVSLDGPRPALLPAHLLKHLYGPEAFFLFLFFFFLNIFIDFAITVVPFPPPTPLHPAHPLPPTFPPIVHVHGSYL